jgi:hypothetical protein
VELQLIKSRKNFTKTYNSIIFKDGKIPKEDPTIN